MADFRRRKSRPVVHRLRRTNRLGEIGPLGQYLHGLLLFQHFQYSADNLESNRHQHPDCRHGGATIYVGFAVTARNNSALNTSTFSYVSLTTATSAIFPNHTDIGSPSPIGTYAESSGVLTMTAGGSDIYTTADHFQFAYVPITGNVTFTARVVSLANTDTNAKAGVMIRNSLDAGSAQASALVTASNGINLDYRSTLNGSTSETKVAGLSAPYWVRVVRSGSSFSVYRSSDGTTWTQIGTTKTITMNTTVLVGLPSLRTTTARPPLPCLTISRSLEPRTPLPPS